jgi:hypothetical protein
MMHRFGMPGRGMMGGWGSTGDYGDYGALNSPVGDTPLTLEQTHELVEETLASYGDPDLVVGEVMQFSQNFYVLVREENSGKGAFELLINPTTGAVSPEHGPNMMWNTKYGRMGGWGMMGGMRGGMMGRGRFAQPADTMSVTPKQAVSYAQQWLDANMPDTIADEAPDEFYGYYTLHTLQDDEISGMLSVNGYTGQVWYHHWHGEFATMTGDHDE